MALQFPLITGLAKEIVSDIAEGLNEARRIEIEYRRWLFDNASAEQKKILIDQWISVNLAKTGIEESFYNFWGNLTNTADGV